MVTSNPNTDLRAKILSKTYESTIVLDILTFNVKEGEIYGLAGQKHARSQLRDYLINVSLPGKTIGLPLKTYSKGAEPTSGVDPKVTVA